MPFEHDALELEADASSVRTARARVAAKLTEIGRADLIDTAELATSELVTNAFLHARAPLSLRVRGTTAHPRVEVRDGSRDLPVMRRQAVLTPAAGHTPFGLEDLDDLGLDDLEVDLDSLDLDITGLPTFGRGLRLVAMCASAWGVDLADEGKTVWFEPSPELHSPITDSVPVFERSPCTPLPEQPDRRGNGGRTTVRLLGAPVRDLIRLRHHIEELARELRLMDLQHHQGGPSGADMAAASDLFVRLQSADLYRVSGRDTRQLEEALARGEEVTDLVFAISARTVGRVSRLHDVLLEADRFCRDERLLTLAFSRRQIAVGEWYLEQIRRQVDGEPPRPWRYPDDTETD